jgi:hypothetical protein
MSAAIATFVLKRKRLQSFTVECYQVECMRMRTWVPLVVIVGVGALFVACGSDDSGSSSPASSDGGADARVSADASPSETPDATTSDSGVDATSDASSAADAADAGDAGDSGHSPSVSDNPPTPAGYKLMPQADVTPDMVTSACGISL